MSKIKLIGSNFYKPAVVCKVPCQSLLVAVLKPKRLISVNGNLKRFVKSYYTDRRKLIKRLSVGKATRIVNILLSQNSRYTAPFIQETEVKKF